MNGTIFDKLWKEYKDCDFAIKKARREIAELEAKVSVYEDTKTLLYSILTDYGNMVYEHYEPKYTLTEKAEESAKC